MKKRIIITLILIVVYFGSLLYMKNWNYLAYGKGGQWESLSPDFGAIVFTYVPVCNTIATITLLGNDPTIEDSKEVLPIDKLAQKLIGEKE